MIERPRRLRRTPQLRALIQETRLAVQDLVYPIFVTENSGIEPIASMPGVYRYGLDSLVPAVQQFWTLGLRSFLIFGIPQHKDPQGSGAWSEQGIVQKALRLLRKELPDALLMSDVCLCEYTSHGHCGLLDSCGHVDNDSTLPLLAQVAVSHARAGADLVAPSDMMDGRVAAIRQALDDHGYAQIPIMAYSVKFSSAFYGPFRDAAGSTPQFGDRKAYQMDPANGREALRELDLDTSEGADILMVKPALAYLDLIRDASTTSHLPIAAYNVSGEYSMVKAAAQNGWTDERRTVFEILTGIKRAGAKIIITYHAPDVARWLQESP